MNETTTTEIATGFHTAQYLADHATKAYSVTTVADGKFTVTFEDAEQAVKAVEVAKAEAFRKYCKNGGNPSNKRSFGSSFAAVKKAIVAAEAGK